jgi:hypothetical protein
MEINPNGMGRFRKTVYADLVPTVFIGRYTAFVLCERGTTL